MLLHVVNPRFDQFPRVIRAATGTADVSGMSDDQIRAALGATPFGD